MNQLFGYRAGNSFIHRLTGGTKLLAFLVLTINGMVSFDLRYLLLLIVIAIVGLAVAGIRWRYVSAVVYFVGVFALMNVVLIYVFAPQYGVSLFHHKMALLGSGPYALTLV